MKKQLGGHLDYPYYLEEERRIKEKREQEKEEQKQRRLKQWSELIEPDLLTLFRTRYAPLQDPILNPSHSLYIPTGSPMLVLGTIKRVELLREEDLIPQLILSESYLLTPERIAGVAIPSVRKWAPQWLSGGEAAWEFSLLEGRTMGCSGHIAKKVVEFGGEEYRIYATFIERMKPKENSNHALFYACDKNQLHRPPTPSQLT